MDNTSTAWPDYTFHIKLLENNNTSFNVNLTPLSIHSYNIKIREDESQNTDTVIAL
jgi:hypothetical protein